MQSIPIVCSLQIHCMGPTAAADVGASCVTRELKRDPPELFVAWPEPMSRSRFKSTSTQGKGIKLTLTGPIYFLGRMHQLDF